MVHSISHSNRTGFVIWLFSWHGDVIGPCGGPCQIKRSALFTTDPESVRPRITNATNVPVDILEAVWHNHNWNTTLTPNMLSILVKEDQWVAGLTGRAPMTEEELADLIDSSILEEALGHRGSRFLEV